ncbi:MAG TPA: hypothetical protein DCQ06_09290 [Myxococcales bacterium]|nr:hypothetical protein [Myxococcales bacterium]HAN31776.1 hypothetical protein [Myxococcales bacterium]
MKKLFKVKPWLIANGVIHSIMGVGVQLAMPGDIAKMAWGEGNVLGHDAIYETVFGLAWLPMAFVLFATALIVTGAQQAKMAVVIGASMLVTFIAMALFGQANGYMVDMNPLAAFGPPIFLMGCQIVSGYLHWNDE